MLPLPISLLAVAGKFGAPLGDTPKVALANHMKDPVVWSAKTVKTEGVVSAVCQGSGCWMTLKSGDQSVHVTLKDDGFFVPIDSAGATAVMDGVFTVRTLPEATAEHYTGKTPGGKSEAIKGEQKELSLVASGLELALPRTSGGATD
jgi:hypothetical protein